MEHSPILASGALGMHFTQIYAFIGVSPRQLSLRGVVVSSLFEVAFSVILFGLFPCRTTTRHVDLARTFHGHPTTGPSEIPNTGSPPYSSQTAFGRQLVTRIDGIWEMREQARILPAPAYSVAYSKNSSSIIQCWSRILVFYDVRLGHVPLGYIPPGRMPSFRLLVSETTPSDLK